MDPAVRTEIERLLLRFPYLDRGKVLVAIDVLREAGPTGLNLARWIRALKATLGEGAGHIVRRVIDEFGCCIATRASDRTVFIYTECPSVSADAFGGDGLDTIDFTGNRQYVARVMAALREMGARESFTLGDLTVWLIEQGIGLEDAQDEARNIVRGAGVLGIGLGAYRVDATEPTTNAGSMQIFYDILRDPGEQPSE